MPLNSKVVLYIVSLVLVTPTSSFGYPPEAFKNLFFESPGLTLEERILGRNCFSIKSSSLGVSCNSADLARQDKNQFRSNLILDQQFDDVLESDRQLKTQNSAQLIEFLNRNQNAPIYSKFFSNLWFQNSSGWLFSFTPFKGGMVSYVRNPTLTEVTTHILNEREWSVRKGFHFEELPKLDFGLSLRVNESQYLREQFLLIEALADPQRYLQATKESNIFLDPSLRYYLNNEQNSQMTVVLSSLRLLPDSSSASPRMSVELGYSSDYTIWERVFTQSIHFSTRPDVLSYRDRLRWAGLYQAFEEGAFSLGLGSSGYSVGYLGRIDSLTLGLGYESETITPDRIRFDTIGQFVVELGLTF